MSTKRQREEVEVGITQTHHHQDGENEQTLKKQKASSYEDIIITLLEEEDEQPNEDLTSLISTLQEEISFGLSPNEAHQPSGSSGEEEEERERVMRHLLEASDDELGIPNTDSSGDLDFAVGGHVEGGDLLVSLVGSESLWEFEDLEAANYYNLLQSEIFI